MKNKKNPDNQEPKVDLDLDEPRFKLKDSLTLKQWEELRKKEPSTLTAEEKSKLEKADAEIRNAFKNLAPSIANAVNFSRQYAEALQNITEQIKSAFNIRLALPTTEPSVELKRALGIDYSSTSNITPALSPPAHTLLATAHEQRIQTNTLKKIASLLEGQVVEREAYIHRAICPSYLSAKRELIFANTIIPIPEGNQDRLCRALFRGERPVKHPIELGDVLEKMLLPPKDDRKVYSAKQAINTLVARKTQLEEFLVVKNHRVWFNEKYL